MTHSVVYNTAAQLLAKVVSMALTVVATMLITRAFGKEGYGQFAIMQTLPALFYILADFGLNTTALKKIAGGNATTAQHYYHTVLSLRLLLSIIFIGILNCSILLLPYSAFLKTGIAVSSVLILTQALYASTNLLFQYKQRYDLSAIGYIAGSVLTLVLVVLAIRGGLDVRLLSFAYVVGGLLTFVVNAGLLAKLRYLTCLRIDLAVAKNLLAGSLPLGLMFIFSQITFKADAILISLLSLPPKLGLTNVEAVAIYTLPYKVFEVALVLPTFFMNAMYPIFVTGCRENRGKLQSVFRTTVKYMLALGLLASATLYVAAPTIVTVLGGQTFGQSVAVLRILAIGLVIFFLTQPISYLIVTLDRQKYLPAIYLASAVFNVTANLMFIPTYSFIASAYITWLSEALILCLLSFAAVKSWREHYAHN
jgi:O-antigen/teichoic acid export membrane protein